MTQQTGPMNSPLSTGIDTGRRQIALLIDYENCALSTGVSPSALISSLRERGRLVVKKAFADWSKYSDKSADSLVQASIELEALSAYRRKGKNAADIRLVVEAMELAIRNAIIDTFVIVSGDSDYIPLVVKLRELGKYVILVADELHASRVLKGFCDELIPLSRLSVPQDKQQEPTQEEEKFALLRRCITTVVEADVLDAGVLKSMLLQLDPTFHESNFGYSRFSEYLRDAEKAGVVKLGKHQNGGLVVTFG